MPHCPEYKGTTLTVRLTAAQTEHLNQVASPDLTPGFRWGGRSEYVRQLIDADIKRHQSKEFESLQAMENHISELQRLLAELKQVQ